MTETIIAVLSLWAVIEGRVVDTDQEPVADCTVVIDTSGTLPNVTSVMDHAHYPDCGKATMTDAEGNFRITDVAEERRFSVRAYKEGFHCGRSQVFVAAEEQPKIQLRPTEVQEHWPQLVGAVVDERGSPRPFAIVSVQETQDDNGKRTYDRSAPRNVLADQDGIFVAPLPDGAAKVRLSIQSPQFAEQATDLLEISDEPVIVKMTKGAAVTGRVMFNDKPAPNVSLSLQSLNFRPDRGRVRMKGGTDKEGRFVFDRLPPEVSVHLATVTTIRNPCVLPTGVVQVPADGQVNDLGELSATPGHKLDVRMVSDDGQSQFGEAIRVSLQNEKAISGNSQEFETPGTLPLGPVPHTPHRLTVNHTQHEVVEVKPWMQRMGYSSGSSRYSLLIDQDTDITVVVRKRQN